jgi:hypothetical protein
MMAWKVSQSVVGACLLLLVDQPSPSLGSLAHPTFDPTPCNT